MPQKPKWICPNLSSETIMASPKKSLQRIKCIFYLSYLLNLADVRGKIWHGDT